MAEILGGGVGGFGREEGDKSVSDEVLDLGAKKREITCCFCFPMLTIVTPSR